MHEVHKKACKVLQVPFDILRDSIQGLFGVQPLVFHFLGEAGHLFILLVKFEVEANIDLVILLLVSVLTPPCHEDATSDA